MADALWNVNGSIKTHDLVARIKASVRQRQGLLSDPVDDGDAGTTTQAEVNQILLESLDLVTQHLEYLQAQVGLVEAWIREETERSAQLHQEGDERFSQLLRLVADLSARVDALEDRAAPRKATGWLSWSRLAGVARPLERP